MSEQLISTLSNMFQSSRVVFWYDDNLEMQELFDAAEIAGVKKLVIDNNEFGIKVQVLHEEPEQKFLIYKGAPAPSNQDDWLLDLRLASVEFRSNISTVYLQDLGWPNEYSQFVLEHEQFFKNAARRNALKQMITDPVDPGTPERLQRTMIAAICQTANSWDTILFRLFDLESKGSDKLYTLMVKANLAEYFWSKMSSRFGYSDEDPNLKALVFEIFETAEQQSLKGPAAKSTSAAYMFINNWQNNTTESAIFDSWSQSIEVDLQKADELSKLDLDKLARCDIYPCVDKIIIRSLLSALSSNSYSLSDISGTINQRRQLHFFADFKNCYEAIGCAVSFLDLLAKTNLTVKSPQEGFNKYTSDQYRIDRLYRQYVEFSESAHAPALNNLTAQIEKKYSNDFLLALGDNWQSVVDRMTRWAIDDIRPQGNFYNVYVEPFAAKDKRILVIISDGLRYEVATELKDAISNEERYTANIHGLLGCLPSYTQLGMASLLPHEKITFDDSSDTVYVDGHSSMGTANRSKILQARHARSIAMSYEDFHGLRRDAKMPEAIKNADVIYVYKNKIDKVGDERSTEGEVFQATRQELRELVDLIKHANSLNIYNMLVTADHGFIYQHTRIDETDYTENEVHGDRYKVNRRFIIGKNLSSHPNMKKFSGEQVGFADDTEILIPKSINRIRIKGAGSRYVHGGASLQEIVVPVLEVNKARQDDISFVEVDVIAPQYKITSNTFGVEFYQKEPIGDKRLPRKLRAAFYDSDGNKISDEKTFEFNSEDKANANRTTKHNFVFSEQASQLSDRQAKLKLEEPIAGTRRFRNYREVPFDMLIAFSNDFGDI